MSPVLITGGTVVDAFGERDADVRTGSDGRVTEVALGDRLWLPRLGLAAAAVAGADVDAAAGVNAYRIGRV